VNGEDGLRGARVGWTSMLRFWLQGYANVVARRCLEF